MTDAPPSADKSLRQRRTDAFLRAADFASVGMMLALMLGALRYMRPELSGWMLLIGAAALVMLVYGSIGVLRHRRNDEFTRDLWHAGTDWVFAAVIVLGIFLPIGIGVYHGATEMPQGERPLSDWLDDWAMALVIMSFFAGLQVRRFRS